MMTRRQALKTAALATAVCAAAPTTQLATAQPAAPAPGGPFTLPPLPYPADALEPHIDARTMEIHHGKHHAAYVSNLNKAVAEFPELGNRTLEDLLKNLSAIPEKVRAAVRNNGGGHHNHALFWQMMQKAGGGAPKGELAKAIDAGFGSFAGFKDRFAEAATKVFGSGWAWLLAEGKQLTIEATPNQDVPSRLWAGATREPARRAGERDGAHPDESPSASLLLGIDVWEHAYYLKYQNRRADYIAAWFNVINWGYVAERFAKLKS